MADLDPLGKMGTATDEIEDDDMPEIENDLPQLKATDSGEDNLGDWNLGKSLGLGIPANPAACVDPGGLYTAYYLAPNIKPKFPIFYWKNLNVLNRPADRY